MNYRRLIRDLKNVEATPNVNTDTTPGQTNYVPSVTPQDARCVDALFPEFNYDALIAKGKFIVVTSRPKTDPLARKFVREALTEIARATERMTK